MMKYFIIGCLQSNKYSAAHAVSCEKRGYYRNTTVYLTKKKYSHRLESDSARNNIHPNNKQKPKITNKTPEK